MPAVSTPAAADDISRSRHTAARIPLSKCAFVMTHFGECRQQPPRKASVGWERWGGCRENRGRIPQASQGSGVTDALSQPCGFHADGHHLFRSGGLLICLLPGGACRTTPVPSSRRPGGCLPQWQGAGPVQGREGSQAGIWCQPQGRLNLKGQGWGGRLMGKGLRGLWRGGGM